MPIQLPIKKRLCVTTEAAKIYGCSPQNMWAMAQRRQVWSQVVGAKTIVFDADEIQRLAKEREQLRRAGKLGGRRPGSKRKTA